MPATADRTDRPARAAPRRDAARSAPAKPAKPAARRPSASVVTTRQSAPDSGGVAETLRRLAAYLGLARPPVKLVALDLDGTLLDSRKRIGSRTVDVLRALPQIGVRVVIASARPPRSCRAIYDGLGLDTWQINYNGALIWDPHRRRVVRHWPMEGRLVWEMARLARGLVPNVQVAAEVVDRWYTDRHDPYRTTVTGKLFRPDVVAPIEQWGRKETTKLMFLSEPRKVARIREALREQYGHLCKVVHADPDLVQVMSNAAGKDVALRVVCEHHGVDPRNALAVGDAINDLELLKAAGTAVTVANGCDECKQASHWTAPSNDDGGVYEAVKRYVPRVRPLLKS